MDNVYSLPDDAWMLELIVLAPASAARQFAGTPIAVGEVPDEDPARDPVVRFPGLGDQALPHAVVRWFLDEVTAEVQRCRG